jgi:pseudaminic acid synthase
VSVKIGKRRIARDEPPYLIAEMSGNHDGSLDKALKIVELAAASGADAVKLQTYTPDTMTLNTAAPGFIIEDEKSLWFGRQLFDLYREAHTPWEWHEPIMRRASELGIHCFSTPFDETSVDFLERLDVPAYKIASFEAVDLPLIRRVARTGKPVIISTGMASAGEIEDATRAVRDVGNNQIVLLKCTSTYPATPRNSNLRTIPNMRDAFSCEIGLSDHTMGCGVAVAAIAFGASMIEKHFTLRRADGGVDAPFSLEPAEFRALRIETDRAWQALGSITYGGTEDEIKSKAFRRSLYISREVVAGEVLTSDNVRIVRPGFGLAPKFYNIILGMRVGCRLPAGTPLTWDVLK